MNNRVAATVTTSLLIAAGFIVLAVATPRAQRAQIAQPRATQAAREVVIRGGWLFDGIRDMRRRNTGIIVRNGKFIEVDADLTGRDVSRAQVLALEEDATILPGMFDLHSHLNMNLVNDGRAEEVTYNSVILLANGVTAIWPAGEFFPERVLEAKRLIDNGKAIGPRIFPSGPYFGAFRCEYTIKTAADECAGWPNNITEQQIRDEVDDWAARGVRSIKIKQATPEEMRIIIDQASRHRITTASHLANYAGGYDVDTTEAILMGLGRVEHWLVRPDLVRAGKGAPGSAEFREMIELFLKHRVYFDPNMRVYQPAPSWNTPPMNRMVWVDEAKFFTPYARMLIETRNAANPPNLAAAPSAGMKQKMAEVKALYDAGGGHLIVAGTDNPTPGPLLPGFTIHRELQGLVFAGLPPAAALKAATINGARALGVGDELGSIEPGKLADLFVARGNPLDDIVAARDVLVVMKAGVAYDPQELLKSAAAKIGPGGPTDHEAWKLKIEPFGVRERH